MGKNLKIFGSLTKGCQDLALLNKQFLFFKAYFIIISLKKEVKNKKKNSE